MPLSTLYYQNHASFFGYRVMHICKEISHFDCSTSKTGPVTRITYLTIKKNKNLHPWQSLLHGILQKLHGATQRIKEERSRHVHLSSAPLPSRKPCVASCYISSSPAVIELCSRFPVAKPRSKDTFWKSIGCARSKEEMHRLPWNVQAFKGNVKTWKV